MTEKMFEYLENSECDYIDFLKNICMFEARATDKNEIDRMIDYIEAFAVSRGFAAEKTLFEKCGNFLTIDINPGKEKGNVFLAHTDTVHLKGSFGENPVTVDGNRMRAPGAVDCKGGIAIALLAMEGLMKCGFNKHTRLVLTSDEEISNILGGQKELDFLKSSVNGFRSAINCETTRNNEVVVARKGILRQRIDICGIGGHSGYDYFTSASAVREAASKILALESLSSRGQTTYNCSVIEGGTVGNIIPDRCSFVIDIRVLDKAGMLEAEKNVQDIANHSYVPGTKSTVTTMSSRMPMIKNEDTLALFRAMSDVSNKYELGELVAVESGGGSDSAYTQAAGIPSICGLGGSGDCFHTDREYIDLNCVLKRAKLLGAFCIEK